MHQRTITDIHGTIIHTSSTTKKELNTSDFPVGVYFLRVEARDKTGVQMFVKVAP
jgi:hypothetical protein